MVEERILLVDDNVMSIRFTEVFLRKQHFVVRTASGARQALEFVETFRPDLVLMDIQLPDIDGFELARRLKAYPLSRNLVIIALTAYSMKEDEEKAIAAGCDAFLTKPIETRSLPLLIRHYLDKRTPAPAVPSPLRVVRRSLNDVFDIGEFKERTGGDLDLMKELIELFNRDAAQLVEAVREAISHDDSRALQRAAHALKGSIANFSASRAHEAAFNLEAMAATGALLQGPAALKVLQDEVEALCEALAKISGEAVEVWL